MKKGGEQLKPGTKDLVVHKNQDQKNVCENSSRKKLNGHAYKEQFKSWARNIKVSAALARNGDKLSGEGESVVESSNCSKAEEKVPKSIYSRLEKQSVECDLKQQLGTDNAKPCSNDGVESGQSLEYGEDHDEDTKSARIQLGVELDKEHIVCSICMFGGELLYCNGQGCKRSFHLSCVDPPFTCAPPGVWYCVWCVQKKIQLGVYSVSEGVESVLDVREVDLNDEGNKQRKRQYLVKYRGLAHVHNHWIPERELITEAPAILAKYKKFPSSRWKTEWALPQRLLQKRSLRLPKGCDGNFLEYDGKDLDCHNEWLVKWNGLGYDCATWELETASFMKSPEVAILKRDFQSQHMKAERVSCLSKEDKERKIPSYAMSQLQCEGPTGVYSQHVSKINKLRECWYRGRSAVVFDDEERFIKVILFILSLQDNDLPFLIITSSTTLSVWKAEFSRHESSNLVVYKGDKHVRASIRSLEFYNKEGCVMFQVMLSLPDIVVEDLRILEGIKWGAIIVDECQRRVIATHLKQMKALAIDFRLLLVTDQLQDRRTQYNNLLSFLGSGLDEAKENAYETDPTYDVCKLKEKLASFIAYKSKRRTLEFSEYWVPVQLSNVQLEQYCAALLSKSTLLCSSLKKASANSLRELLVSEGQCCNHPYLMNLDHSLQGSLTRDLSMDERLTAEIKMSGKLQLLDKFLLHIKEQGLRVLIVFQPFVGHGMISTGDVLDDFIHQKFGKDSYARFDGGETIPSRKQAALDFFNSEESSQFVFLIERRACLRSIKLSSVDTIILFDSDWDALNDLRALQKIRIQSQFEQLKVFRLYSVYTVEEKVLILAKEGIPPDKSEYVNRRICHKLLTWGALQLFDKLDHFHGQNEHSNITNENSFLNDVVSEFSALLPNNGENRNPSTSIILKVDQTKEAYERNISLYGEVEAQSAGNISLIQRLMHDESPDVFWTNLLKGRHPRWKFLSSSSNMVERENTDKLFEETESTEDASRRKCWMVNSTNIHVKSRMKRKRGFYAEGKDSKLGAAARPASKPLQYLHGKKDNSNGIRGSSLTTIKTHSILRGSDGEKDSSMGTKFGQFHKDAAPIIREVSAFDLIESRLTSKQTQTCPAQGSKEQQHQLPSSAKLPPAECDKATVHTSRNVQSHQTSQRSTFHQQGQVSISSTGTSSTGLDKLKDSNILPPTTPAPIQPSIDRSLNRTEPRHKSQNMATVVACNTQLPQVSPVPLEVPHSALLDPLQIEMEKLQKNKEQALKIHEEKKSRLKAKFEKEIDEVTKKYVESLDDAEAYLLQTINDLETYHKKVYGSRLLAQAFTAKFDSTEAAELPAIQAATRTQRFRQSLASEHCTTTTMDTRAFCPPIINPSPSINLSSNSPALQHNKVPTTALPPVPLHQSSAVLSSSPVVPSYHPMIPHRGNFGPNFGIRAPAPHLRRPQLPAEVSLTAPLPATTQWDASFTAGH